MLCRRIGPSAHRSLQDHSCAVPSPGASSLRLHGRPFGEGFRLAGRPGGRVDGGTGRSRSRKTVYGRLRDSERRFAMRSPILTFPCQSSHPYCFESPVRWVKSAIVWMPCCLSSSCKVMSSTLWGRVCTVKYFLDRYKILLT